jgi:hypothetical protein
MAVWIDMNADGRLDLLTSRATKPLFGSGSGELLWLEQPATEALANGNHVPHLLTVAPMAAVVIRVPVSRHALQSRGRSM